MDLPEVYLSCGCRMVGCRDKESSEAMIDVTYRQTAEDRELVAVLQKLYLCASVEFLMAVTDFFLQAMPQSSHPTMASAQSDRLSLKQSTEPRAEAKISKINLSPRSNPNLTS